MPQRGNPGIGWGIMLQLTTLELLFIQLGYVCILLGISPASDCGLPTFRNRLSVPSSRALEDGTDRVFRKVGKLQF